jgi:hypothetical protein
MALQLLREGVFGVRDPSSFSERYGRRIIDETREEIAENNLPESPELGELLNIFQHPHLLSEPRQFIPILRSYAETLVVDRRHGMYSLDAVYGGFNRESNVIIGASKANRLVRSVLIDKVFILSMILSSGRIPDSSGLIIVYRMMVQKMMATDQSVQPLLALLADGGGVSVEQMITTFEQLMLPKTLVSKG